MAAQMYGELREDATHGERMVYKRLREYLPKEYSVYVECPLPSRHRIPRFPDFVVLTNYGVVVLEVKDWVMLERADRFGAEVRTRKGQVRREKNPVTETRELALELDNLLRSQGQSVDWGYAVILPNLPKTTLANLRITWGEGQVWGEDDLLPDIVLKRLSATRPSWAQHNLSREQIQKIRQIINPVIEFEHPDRPLVILDEAQERIVVEPVRPGIPAEEDEKPVVQQLDLALPQAEPSEEVLPEAAQRLVQSLSVRLLRGPAGSGKTIVLTQRARYLAAQHPQWKILVLTYNRPLCDQLQRMLNSVKQLEVRTLHSLCGILWNRSADSPQVLEDRLRTWLTEQKSRFPVIQKAGVDFLEQEITWIKDIGFTEQEAYVTSIRKGMGERRLSAEDKQGIFQVMQAYDRFIQESSLVDYVDLPGLTLKALQTERIQRPLYDAVLIDEAQDFAPTWIRIVKEVVKPDGALFLADDPSQSIFRFFSWREKGLEVVGRTRHLKLPYRNTFEIYRAAQALLENDPILKERLQQEEFLPAEVDERNMRHGKKPVLQQFKTFEQECNAIHDQVRFWLQRGIKPAQIGVLHPRKAKLDELSKALRGTEVKPDTLPHTKGLEYEVVILSQAQLIFEYADNNERKSVALRQLFMAMTRAREHLMICYEGRLSEVFEPLRPFMDWLAG
jgi:hypothetical protein